MVDEAKIPISSADAAYIIRNRYDTSPFKQPVYPLLHRNEYRVPLVYCCERSVAGLLEYRGLRKNDLRNYLPRTNGSAKGMGENISNS
jgi:hypothetical protein